MSIWLLFDTLLIPLEIAFDGVNFFGHRASLLLRWLFGWPPNLKKCMSKFTFGGYVYRSLNEYERNMMN